MTKQRKVLWRVVGFGFVRKFLARHPAGAVSQFRKDCNLPIKSDRVNGGWDGVSVNVVGSHGAPPLCAAIPAWQRLLSSTVGA